METILFFLHHGLLLLFGLSLSYAFSGIRLKKKNIIILLAQFIFCGLLQVLFYAFWGETVVWRLYPFIVHIPTLLILCLIYKARISTALAAISTAYLCCQPAKWFGLLVKAFTGSYIASQNARIISLILVWALSIFYLAEFVSEIYNKDNRSVWIFGIVPEVYYLFDYITGVYGDFWTFSQQNAFEFLPFFLCIVYLVFCVVYYREYEQKAEAERKEHLIRFTIEQQRKELEAMKRSEQVIRLLRHDMRLLLGNLSVCIDNGDLNTAKKLISGYSANVESTAIKRYCNHDTLNYILCDYNARCQQLDVDFQVNIGIVVPLPDEVLMISILSNALDNSLNAQRELQIDKRFIRLMIKNTEGKLLISVKNPYKTSPVFVDDLPISRKPGHGYGVRSIRYMTEQLGGNCRFSLEDGMFVLQIVI